jgi:hypothetical protein
MCPTYTSLGKKKKPIWSDFATMALSLAGGKGTTVEDCSLRTVQIGNGQSTHEEMLNIPGHKGNVNQNCIKIPPPSC